MPRTQLARFFCNLLIQVARSTPLAMQSSNRLILASMHARLIGGGMIAAFLAGFLADFFEAFFALRLVAIRSDSYNECLALGTPRGPETEAQSIAC